MGKVLEFFAKERVGCLFDARMQQLFRELDSCTPEKYPNGNFRMPFIPFDQAQSSLACRLLAAMLAAH